MATQLTGQGTEAATAFMRCPDCGGLNPVEAEWCGQCARRFGAPPPPPPEPANDLSSVDEYFAESLDPPSVAPLTPHTPGALERDPLGVDDRDPLGLDAPPPVLPQRRAPAHGAPPPVRRGAFVAAGSEIGWTCRVCDEVNPIELTSCRVCRSSFAETIRPASRKISGDPNTAALYSLFFPGAGHAYIGMWAQAIARGLLSSWVVLVSAFLLFGGGGKLAASVFVLASVGLWLAAAHDAYREASHEAGQVLLHGRRFMYVTVGLLGLLFLMLLVGAASVAR